MNSSHFDTVKEALFKSYDILIGDKEPTASLLNEIGNIVEGYGYELGWQFSDEEEDDAT